VASGIRVLILFMFVAKVDSFEIVKVDVVNVGVFNVKLGVFTVTLRFGF